MTKQQAKKEACRRVALLIESYLGVGQPWTDCENVNPKHPVGADTCPDCDRLAVAFTAIQFEMERRSD